MKLYTLLFCMSVVGITQAQQAKPVTLVATTYNSGFELAHDTYNGMYAASDNKIYYVLSSQSIDIGGKMYAYDPATNKTTLCGDLTEACGEKGLKTIVQGKSHVKFVESDGKLFFATHIGYYSMVDGMEKMGIPPAGYREYPGGHLLAYDLKTGKYDDLAIAPHKEGILAMNMDTKRKIIYGLTWPTGYFFRYDLAKKEMQDFGSMAGDGENGVGNKFRTVCRSIAVDPEDGSAYFTTSEGTIYRCRSGATSLEPLEENMKKDYFGLYDPSSPGHMGYNWRQTVYSPTDKCFYGVHGNSGYLFKFDPKAERIEVLDRLTSDISKRSGMFDQFSYGYLGFEISKDKHTLYYLTGAPVYKDGKRVTGKSSTAMGEAKGLEDLHLVTYDIPTGKIKDHGAVLYKNGDRPLYVNSIAVAKDGTVYTLARIAENGKSRTDLVKIPVGKK
ncbi:hypothetical protein QWZ08_14280 [Ferruginibacter paludis]|uniref:hypothetical protein n=1 Tax=Ferruginibacter paludis TaxID=1310417 RepID=UPI0025B3A906|nr:hypothetical protein [Ferruginibacter paludis]MDN3656810.1 hypothetical protein [Ferruginibacter paludis]